MKMENKNVRKRKALLILPLLVIPFLTLAFWAMGGGKGEKEKQSNSSGLNMQLPNAHLKDNKGENKLSFYDEAEKDSARFREEIKSDPLFQLHAPKDTGLLAHGNKTFDLKPDNYKDPNEEKVYAKLAELNQQLNNNVSTTREKPGQLEASSVKKEDVDRLEGLMQHVNKDSGNDPEMAQLNGMMEKILDIQHPERVRDTLKQNSLEHKRQVFPVTMQEYTDNISLSVNDTLFNGKADTLSRMNGSNGFYSLNDQPSTDVNQNAIEAAIHETQTVVSGATVKLRLLSDVYIAGRLVPKSNFVFGTASLNGERLNITVTGVRYQNSLLPVALSAYDMDGLEGIYIPGAISRDVAKQSSDNALQSVGLNNLDPSIGIQAAGAGIQAAKNLISKKVKLVKVTVKAGYQVLLKDNNDKQ
jgi:conjugative transposon TraM protein